MRCQRHRETLSKPFMPTTVLTCPPPGSVVWHKLSGRSMEQFRLATNIGDTLEQKIKLRVGRAHRNTLATHHTVCLVLLGHSNTILPFLTSAPTTRS